MISGTGMEVGRGRELNPGSALGYANMWIYGSIRAEHLSKVRLKCLSFPGAATDGQRWSKYFDSERVVVGGV